MSGTALASLSLEEQQPVLYHRCGVLSQAVSRPVEAQPLSSLGPSLMTLLCVCLPFLGCWSPTLGPSLLHSIPFPWLLFLSLVCLI